MAIYIKNRKTGDYRLCPGEGSDPTVWVGAKKYATVYDTHGEANDVIRLRRLDAFVIEE